MFYVKDLKTMIDHLPKIRIREHAPKKWVVEVQKKTWYGRSYWTHALSVFGISSEPWYFSSYEMAAECAAVEFRFWMAFCTGES